MAARSRNRPRTGLAWLVVVVGLALALGLCRSAFADACAADQDPPCAPPEPHDDGAELDETALDDEDLDTAAGTGELYTSGVIDTHHATVEQTEALLAARRSRWGRIDLSVAWRRQWQTRWSKQGANEERDDQLWLVAMWRR